MRRILLLVLSLSFVIGTRAQDMPAVIKLEGVTLVYQDINRCSAAAFTMLLSYWVEEIVSYDEIITRLNPSARDVSVRVEEMVQIADEKYGLNGIVRRGGTIDLLKSLVANGFPVLVENTYYDGDNPSRDWMSHNRVLIGYDDALQELYFFDSLLGAGEDEKGRPMSYTEFDERWLAFNRDYLVLYPEERAATLELILADRWDEQKNAQWVIDQAAKDVEAATNTTNKAFALMNAAYGYKQLGDTAYAAQLIDEARATNGLPWRYFWYDFNALDVFLAEGHTQEVIDLASTTLAATNGVEELYYYIGSAAQLQGDTVRARGNFEAAVQGNIYYLEAIDALAAIGG